MIDINQSSAINEIFNNQKDKNIAYLNRKAFDVMEQNQVYKSFVRENCEDFYTYIDGLGLANDPDIIVLPSTHHYYYDTEDLKNVKTIVNLKHLNQINQLKGFLHTFFHVLPPTSYFLGCFIDNDKRTYSAEPGQEFSGVVDPFDNGIASRNPFVNLIYNLLDSRTNRSLNKKSVRLLLESHGFRLTDMTELNGITYFCTKRATLSA